MKIKYVGSMLNAAFACHMNFDFSIGVLQYVLVLDVAIS